MQRTNQTVTGTLQTKLMPQAVSKETTREPELAPSQVTMYHDGECPLCKFEVDAMQKLDIKKAIRWVDITKEKEALDEAGITYHQAMARIHVRDEKHNMLTGVRGFLAVWEHLRYYRRVVPVIRHVPLLLSLMETVYTIFAKYRLPMTGKKQLKAENELNQ